MAWVARRRHLCLSHQNLQPGFTILKLEAIIGHFLTIH